MFRAICILTTVILTGCSGVSEDKIVSQMNRVLSTVQDKSDAENQLQSLIRRQARGIYVGNEGCLVSKGDGCDVSVSDGVIRFNVNHRNAGSFPNDAWKELRQSGRDSLEIVNPSLRTMYMPPLISHELLGRNNYFLSPVRPEPNAQFMSNWGNAIHFESENAAIRALALMNAIKSL